MSTRFLRRYWPLLLGTPLVAVLVAFVVSKQLTPEYESTATVVVFNVQLAGTTLPGSGQDTPSQLPPGLSDLQVEERIVATYVQLVQRTSVMDAVRATLGYSGTNEELAKKITVSNPANTQLIEISAVDEDPRNAAMIASAVANEFVARSATELGRAGLFGVAEEASVPDSPVSPNIPFNMALALIVGGMAATSVALVLDRFNRTLMSAEDVQELTSLPVLGTIPSSGMRELADTWTNRRNSSWVTAVRRLRATLINLGVGSSYRSLYVTSQEPGAGKSVLVGNLGVALANAGRRVILLDLNLNSPQLHKLFNIPNQSGIAEYLSGRVEAETLAKGTAFQNLLVIPAGEANGEAEDLLARSSPQALIQDLLNDTDVLLIDGPALARSSAAILLSSCFDMSLIVAAAGKTTETDLQELEHTLADSKMPVLGIVINRSRDSVTLRRAAEPALQVPDLDVIPESPPRLRAARPGRR